MPTTCQACNRRHATVHLTEVAAQGGVSAELHICSHCVGELGLRLDSDPPAIADILAKVQAGAGEHADAAVPGPETVIAEAACPGCGLLFSEYATNNLFGCAGCYDAFRSKVDPLLRRYHGSVRHAGRGPEQVSTSIADRAQRRRALDALLREAVQAEHFERAAELRDALLRIDQEPA